MIEIIDLWFFTWIWIGITYTDSANGAWIIACVDPANGAWIIACVDPDNGAWIYACITFSIDAEI